MAHVRQSRPDSGLDVQVKASKTFQVVPSLLKSGYEFKLITPLLMIPDLTGLFVSFSAGQRVGESSVREVWESVGE